MRQIISVSLVLMRGLARPTAIWIIGLGIFSVLEMATNAYHHLIILFVLINALLAMSAHLVIGVTGQFSLGHAGLMAIGAYGSAYFASSFWFFVDDAAYNLNLFIAIFFGGALAAAIGGLIGHSCLRLRGDYLAIVTLGFGEIVRVFLQNCSAVGGALGFGGFPGFLAIPIHDTNEISHFLVSYGIISAIFIITFFALWRLSRSTTGRGLIALRDDELVAQTQGIPVTQFKVWVFVWASFLAGIAGALFAHTMEYLTPGNFDFLRSIDIVIMVVLGGLGSLSGAVIAAGVLTILLEGLRFVEQIIGWDLRMIIYGLVLILLMLWRPQGLLGGKELSFLRAR